MAKASEGNTELKGKVRQFQEFIIGKIYKWKNKKQLGQLTWKSSSSRNPRNGGRGGGEREREHQSPTGNEDGL